MSRAYLLLALILLSQTALANSLSVPVPDCAPTIRVADQAAHLTAPDYASLASPGNPALPFRDLRIILPPGADPTTIVVSLAGDTRATVPVKSPIAPAPPIAISTDDGPIHSWGRNKQIVSGRNANVYSTDAFYPATNVQILSVGSLRKWRIATVRYFPFRYNPVSRLLERTTGGQISLSYTTTMRASSSAVGPTDVLFDDTVQSISANYSQAKTWYATAHRATASALDNESPVGYTIITTSAIVSGSTRLQDFINHKTSRGFTVDVETESQWGGGAGDTAAENIRAYLRANYVSRKTKYVLLIGDPDPTVGDVPMKMLWPRYGEDTYQEAPSDYFYADLTGSWDLNGDGYSGEEADIGPGGIDGLPEVIVGRIPFYGDFTALDSILKKTIDYESGALRGSWVRNVLLSMKPSDSDTPGYQLGEAIKDSAAVPAGMAVTRVYESDYGLNPQPDYVPCSYDNVLSAWKRHAGFHFWWTHGNPTFASDVMTTNNSQYLDDSYPSFVFQCSCHNGYPEYTNNLGFALLKNGAIATDSATRVSWYYPGETVYTNTDSNAGMAYTYALKLIRDHLPCGDAHYRMFAELPNTIWMNHLVFNVYGDPSVAYPAAPVISHNPLRNTDITTQPYVVKADISTTSPMAAGYPALKWNTIGDTNFTSVQMTRTTGATYSATIPAQPYGTTLYYYIEAADTAGESSKCPFGAPEVTLSFQVEQDNEPPTIIHKPMQDTGNKFGPYPILATIVDDLGVQSAALHYNVNGGAYKTLAMAHLDDDDYHADIPGPTMSGDTVNYYITASDTSLNHNESRQPETGSFSFRIAQKISVAVLNYAFDYSTQPSYFVGRNSNVWSAVSDILNADPQHRFQLTVLDSLAPSTESPGLPGQDVLVLPDNGVPADSLQVVQDWFQPGKVILGLDSAASYAAYTGWMWPAARGSSGYGLYWTNDATPNDQVIWLSHPITVDYYVGQTISSADSDAQFYANMLPADAHALAGSATDATHTYAAYRDVPMRGRFVLLGPYVSNGTAPIASDQYAMIREALIAPAQPRQIRVVSPNGGEYYTSGQTVRIDFNTTGEWTPDDCVALKYCTGLDTEWRQVPGAESLPYNTASFFWDTTGMPGSHSYRIKAEIIGGEVYDESNAPFTIVPDVRIPEAKALPDGALVRLGGKVVTSPLAGSLYIEEPDRTGGIRVNTASIVSNSSLVTLVGVLNTVNGERVIDAETAETIGVGAKIAPIAMRTSTVGGGACGLQQPVSEYRQEMQSGQMVGCLMPAAGASNVGMLVRVCGNVTESGSGWFYIDDGCRCNDGTGNAGVRVTCPGVTPPSKGDYVVINAISSTFLDHGNVFRSLLLYDRANIATLMQRDQ